MRHRKNTKRFGRTSSHRKATLAALVCALIEEKRIMTTLPKAKEARRLADKMVTLGRKGTLAARRQAQAKLRMKKCVKKLFDEIVPQFEGRNGGYTRIIKSHRRMSDSSDMAILEWVGITAPSKKRKTRKEDLQSAQA